MPLCYLWDRELAKIRTVIFDFDYTLADSSSAVIECCNAALEGIGLPPENPEHIRRTIGLSLPDTLARLAGEEHRHRSPEFRQIWRSRSELVMLDKTKFYSEARQAIRTLESLDVTVGIVSTKWRQRIVDVLDRENLADAFPVIVGGDNVEEHKPSPEGLIQAMDMLGVGPSQTAYVGDSTTDAVAAQRAETSFVAVLSGVTLEHEFSNFEPLGVLPHVGEINARLLNGAGTIRD